MKLTYLRKKLNNKEFEDIIRSTISHSEVLRMRKFMSHGRTSTLEHCVNVSYLCYRLAKAYKLDYVSIARAALLHDFYLYDWHDDIPLEIDKRGKHAFYHPKVALENADKYFMLNNIERDVILRHMWPVTIIPPRSKEGWIIVLVDKYCAFMETMLEIRINLAKRAVKKNVR